MFLAAPNEPLIEYDSSGAYLRQFGARGSGTGEYIDVTRVITDGRSTYGVLDAASLRVVRFDANGRPLGAYPIGARRNVSGISGWPGGVVLFILPPGDSIAAPVEATFATERAGAPPSDVASFTSSAVAVRGRDLQPMRPFFVATPSWAVSTSGALVYAAGKDAVLVRFGPDGARDLLLDTGIPARPVTTGDLDTEKRRVLKMFEPDWQARTRPFVDRAAQKAARNHPVITDVAVLRDSSIWVRESPGTRSDTVRWNVFRADGRWRGYAALNARAKILDGNATTLLVATEVPDGSTVNGAPFLLRYGVVTPASAGQTRGPSTLARDD